MGEDNGIVIIITPMIENYAFSLLFIALIVLLVSPTTKRSGDNWKMEKKARTSPSDGTGPRLAITRKNEIGKFVNVLKSL